MRALVTRGGGLVMEEVDEPAPAASEAVIAVQAVSLNRGEVNRLPTAPDGWRPGWDIAGTVTGAAADGSGPPKGERVVGFAGEGGWAERVAVPTGQLGALPAGVEATAAATLPVAAGTALRALRLAGGCLGRHVLVTGASGGVGQFALQLARRSGAAGVAGIVRDPHHGGGLPDLGATEGGTAAEWPPGSFDVILESVGGATLARALGCIGPGGTIVVFGSSSREDCSLQLNDLYRNQARLLGYFALVDFRRDPVGPDLAHLAQLLSRGELVTQVSHRVPWDRAGEAVAAVRDRAITGKAVLTVG